MEIEVAELKLELKQWELSFYKKNGRKPTKNDAARSPEMKQKYDRFIRFVLIENVKHTEIYEMKGIKTSFITVIISLPV